MEAGSTRAEHSRLFGFLCCCVLCFFVVLWFATAPGGVNQSKQTCTLKRDSDTFEMEIGLAEALLVALREEISYSQKTQEQHNWKRLAESVCGRQDFEALIGSAALTDPVLRVDAISWLDCIFSSDLLSLTSVPNDIRQEAWESRRGRQHLTEIADAKTKSIFVVSNDESSWSFGKTMTMLREGFNPPLAIFDIRFVPADLQLGCECIAWMHSMGGIIFVYRDIKEVLIEAYNEQKLQSNNPEASESSDFSTFFHEHASKIVEKWRNSTDGWMQQAGVIQVYYSDIEDERKRSEMTIPRLADVFKLEIRETAPTSDTDNSSSKKPKPRKNENMFSRDDEEYLHTLMTQPQDISSLLVGDQRGCTAECGPSRLRTYTADRAERINKELGRKKARGEPVWKYLNAPIGCLEGYAGKEMLVWEIGAKEPTAIKLA